jgi:hypothetical protein
MRKLLFVALVLLVPTLASAQTNVKNPYKVNFCSDGKDQDGVVLTGAVQVIVVLDGTDQPPVALPASSGATGCVTGSNKYTVAGSSAKGSHSVTVKLSSADGVGDPAAVPFSFAVVGKPPSTPTAVTVTQ